MTVLHLADCNRLNALIAAAKGNGDVFKRLDFLHPDARRDPTQLHALVTDAKGIIIAAASVQASPREPDCLWILGVSVDKHHRQQGHATRMLRHVFTLAAAKGHLLEASSFTEDGQRWLAPLMARLHGEYPALRLRYSRCHPPIIDGRRPYRLEMTGMGTWRAVFGPQSPFATQQNRKAGPKPS